MAFKDNYIKRNIIDNLAFLSKNISLSNSISLFDVNRDAQDFFAGLFSIVFNYNNLKELDKLNDVPNYPAIDLGDKNQKIAFQITTDNSSEKVKDTLKKFLKHKLYNDYDRLVFYFIGNKQTSYSLNFKKEDNVLFDNIKNNFSLNGDGSINFDKENDIWDDKYLMREINKIDDSNTLRKIEEFLEEKLYEYKFPDNLLDEDIKKCIEILKRDFGTSKILEFNIKRGNINSKDFINDKNIINNISWDFFKEKIQGHIKYNETIYSFLHDERNKDIRSDFFIISGTIQEFYNTVSNDFNSFEEVFKEVFNKVNILYDDNLDKIKISILLHNMYFNCDIGNNPK